MLYISILVILTILFAVYYSPWKVNGSNTGESFRSCSDCKTSGVLPLDGIIVLNPFIAPYSSNQCVDDLYIQAKDQKKSDFYLGGPLTNLSSPDHVVLTN